MTTQIDIRRLHGEYQEAYGMAMQADKLATVESRFRGGMVHHDGRPVTLVNSGGDWGMVERLRNELLEARGIAICPEHHFEHPKEKSCAYPVHTGSPFQAIGPHKTYLQ